MAPRKPAAGENVRSKKATATKNSADNKVVKRPARGYHTFRNGMLNVTPKGAEKELARRNQMSPLLGLPPEIRNTIWKHVLGGKAFVVLGQKGSRDLKFTSSPSEAYNAMSLLRLCRQVYAEAAVMPLLHSTFSFTHLSVLKRMKSRQRKHVTSIRLECQGLYPSAIREALSLVYNHVSLPKLFPSLKMISVRIFGVPAAEDGAVQETEDRVRQELESMKPGFQVDLKVQKTAISWTTISDSWKGTTVDTELECECDSV